MRTVSDIGIWTFFVALYYGVTGALGAEFMGNFTEFMFGPYIQLWEVHYVNMMPGWAHPVVLILIAALIVAVIPGFLRIARVIAIIIIGVFFARVLFMIFGGFGAPPITIMLLIYAVFAIGWLFFAAALGEMSLWLWLRTKFGRA